MKKVTLFLLLFSFFAMYAAAQDTYNEVVYLKNGSIIRGIVIEQVPSVSLKIKTADGSVFAYPMTEVEKITKEPTPTRQRYAKEVPAGKHLRGYKGFVDAGYQFELSDYNANSFEVMTSHGYQFNNYIFVGGGTGLIVYTEADKASLPFFSNFRVNFCNKSITPFADAKLGYSIGSVSGAYGSLAVGMRFTLKNKKAINLRLEYSAQEQEDYEYNSLYLHAKSFTISSLGLKVGIEF